MLNNIVFFFFLFFLFGLLLGLIIQIELKFKLLISVVLDFFGSMCEYKGSNSILFLLGLMNNYQLLLILSFINNLVILLIFDFSSIFFRLFIYVFFFYFIREFSLMYYLGYGRVMVNEVRLDIQLFCMYLFFFFRLFLFSFISSMNMLLFDRNLVGGYLDRFFNGSIYFLNSLDLYRLFILILLVLLGYLYFIQLRFFYNAVVYFFVSLLLGYLGFGMYSFLYFFAMFSSGSYYGVFQIFFFIFN